MSKKISLFLLSWISLSSSLAQFSPGCFALRDVNIIDGVSKEIHYHQTLIINGKIIRSIGPLNEIHIPDSCVVFNLPGKYVMPGLIDTHVHLATDPSETDSRSRAEKDLRDMLYTGITSVRDMAGDARELASLSRDALLDEIVSPDIYYTALMAGPSFFSDPRTHQTSAGGIAGDMPYMKAITDSTNLEIAVAEAKGTGATAIKLYAQLSGDLAKKITSEAHRQHMQVWSHADLTIASPKEVIEAGVNTISHAGMLANWPKPTPEERKKPNLGDPYWDKAFENLPINEYIRSMLANQTILDATMLVYQTMLNDSSLKYPKRARAVAAYEIGIRFTRLAHQIGIPVCTGTDSDEDKFVQREIKCLVNLCGFTPMDALISSTRIGAMAIGIENITGTIEEGKNADILILNANPATDIENIGKVVMVIKNGKLFVKQ